MIHQSLPAALKAKPESPTKKRPYHIYAEGEAFRELDVYVWAAHPQAALATYAASLGIAVELADGGRVKVGFRTKLRELVKRDVRSKAAEALLKELQELLTEDDLRAEARAEAKAAAEGAKKAGRTEEGLEARREGSPVESPDTATTPENPPGRAGIEQNEDTDPELDRGNPDFDDEDDDLMDPDNDDDDDDDLMDPDEEDEPEESVEPEDPPGGGFDDDDQDDFTGWKGPGTE